MELGLVDEAVKVLQDLISRFDTPDRRSHQNDILTITAWLATYIGELNLTKAVEESQFPKDEDEIKNHIPFAFRLAQYSSELIQYLPHRLEMNRVLMLLYSRQWEKAHTIVLQMKQISGLPKILEKKIRILEVWLYMVEKDGWSETGKARSLYDHFRLKDGWEFEKHLSSIFNKLGSHRISGWKSGLETKCQKQLVMMKETSNPKDPLHQYFLNWTQLVIDDVKWR